MSYFSDADMRDILRITASDGCKPQPKPPQTSQELAERILDAISTEEILELPSSEELKREVAIATKLIDFYVKVKEAEAQRAAIEQCAVESGERSPEGVSSHTMLGDMWDRRISGLASAFAAARVELEKVVKS